MRFQISDDRTGETVGIMTVGDSPADYKFEGSDPRAREVYQETRGGRVGRDESLTHLDEGGAVLSDRDDGGEILWLPVISDVAELVLAWEYQGFRVDALT